MERIIFEKGIAELDLATLQRTANYEMALGGLPKNRPIEHHKLIEHLCDKADGLSGMDVKIDPIYAVEKKTMRVAWNGSKEDCPIENHLVQRLTTRIQMKHKSDTDMNMAIGLSYNEKGLTLAMGPNIWVCSNQNIFGGNLMSTYKAGKKEKMSFVDINQVIDAWFANFEAKRESDYGKITLLKDTVVDRGSVKLLYGELIEEAVLANMNNTHEAPMNQSQVAEFIRQSYSEEYMVPVTEDVTAWDITQMGTAVLKPHRNDFTTSYQTLNSFNEFVLNKYNLN